MSTPFYDLASLVVVPSGYKASKVYAQKPQTTDGQLAFTRSTTATRVNSAGLIEASAINVPRLDYLNSSCPRLLLEPQRTNLTTYSEQIDNAGWSKLSGAGGSTPIVTANYGLAPDGTMSAERVQLARTTTSFSYSEVKQNFGTSGTQYTVSVYLKSLSGTPTIAIANDGSTFNYLATLTNDWVRYTATFTASGTSSAELIVYQQLAATSLSADFLVWGFQAEAGAYATSYIPTTTASVTRGADAASKTSATALIGQTEGTVFVEFKRVPKGVNYQAVVTLQGASSAYLIEMYFGSANTLVAGVYNSGTQFESATSALSEGTYKAALAYKTNDFAFYVNGVQISTDNSGTVPALSTYNLGDFSYSAGSPQADGINQALLFTTRLTNAQLAELTTI